MNTDMNNAVTAVFLLRDAVAHTVERQVLEQPSARF